MLLCDRDSSNKNPMLNITVRVASTDEIYLRKNICGSCWKELSRVIENFFLQKESS